MRTLRQILRTEQLRWGQSTPSDNATCGGSGSEAAKHVIAHKKKDARYVIIKQNTREGCLVDRATTYITTTATLKLTKTVDIRGLTVGLVSNHFRRHPPAKKTKKKQCKVNSYGARIKI